MVYDNNLLVISKSVVYDNNLLGTLNLLVISIVFWFNLMIQTIVIM
jgi:hypothetical protein